jgi:hypothetical protein
MILSTGNKRAKLVVHFSHDKHGEEHMFPTTYCVIKKLRNREVIGNGIAVCNATKDRFDSKIGRKISLTMALQMTNLNRAARRHVWMSYHKICPIK